MSEIKNIVLMDEIKELDADISESRFYCDVSKVLGIVTVADGRRAEVTLKLNTDKREWSTEDYEYAIRM